MPWKEFIIDNYKSTIGESRRKDKFYIIIFKGVGLTFRITARYHDGVFKWYLDCEDANIYDSWIAVIPVETRASIKRVAIHILKSNLDSIKNFHATEDIETAEKELDQKRA